LLPIILILSRLLLLLRLKLRGEPDRSLTFIEKENRQRSQGRPRKKRPQERRNQRRSQ